MTHSFRFVCNTLFIGICLITIVVPSAQASGESLQIADISPLGAIAASTTVSFTVFPSGFINPTYTITDPFSASGSTKGAIDKLGVFRWKPTVYDAGTHTIVVKATDTYDHAASTTVSILVSNNAVLITELSPGPIVSLGQPITFKIVTPGFTSPSYFLYQSYAARNTLSNRNIDSTGKFSWTPTYADLGTNTFTIAVTDISGNNAQTTQTITVINPPTPVVTPTATTTASSTAARTPSVATASSTTATTTEQTTKYLFTTYLAIGSRGAAVSELQKRLTALGIYSAGVTGYFGPLTAAGVKQFQGANNIERLGFVGPATRAALNK